MRTYHLSAVCLTIAAAAGAQDRSAIATFCPPYDVLKPDARLEVTADYGHELTECREDNNRRKIEIAG